MPQKTTPVSVEAGVALAMFAFACLEGVAKAELELPFRRVGIALRRHTAEATTCRVAGRVIPIGVVGVVEGLSPEDQLMVLMAGDDVEGLLHCRG